MQADQIPVAHTPEGGYGESMPPPFLEGCDDPLVAGAPDLRGTWSITAVSWKGSPPPDPDRMLGHLQRIEQCGDRVCITSGGVVHDMRCDGTAERGVNDVAAAGGQPITVVATFEDGVHVLRPVGIDGVEVTRRLEGDELVWDYGPMFVARLRKVEP